MLNPDNLYDLLEEHYNIERGTNAWKLNGTCPRCEKSSSDLRLFCKTPEKFENEIESFKDSFSFCHHCSESISALTYVNYILDISWKEAEEWLEREDSFIKTAEEIEAEKEQEFPYPDCISIKDSPIALEYAHTRGFTDKDILMFGLLFTCSDIAYMGRDRYFKNRLFFPIYSRCGTLEGYICRSIYDSRAKYMFAPFFQKSNHLYSSHMVQKETPLLVLCEGVVDCIAYWRIGVPAVACFGKTISKKQLDILLEINPKRLYLAFDADAIMKSFLFYEKYQHIFDIIKIMNMEHDADEMTEYDLKSTIVNAIDYCQDQKLLLQLGG